MYKNIEMSNTCFINLVFHILFLPVHLHTSKQNTALIWSKHHVRKISSRHLTDLVTYLTAQHKK